MGKNLDKSRRRWEGAPGVNVCGECGLTGGNRKVSFKPTRLVLCLPCWEHIYIWDRKTPTLFSNEGGE